MKYHNTGLCLHIHPHHLYKYTTAPGPGWTATSPATCEYCSKEDDCTTGMERPDVASHQGFDGMIVTSRVASKSSCFQFFLAPAVFWVLEWLLVSGHLFDALSKEV